MRKTLFIAALLLATAGPALAAGEDQCATDCPSGQKKAGFADGDKATCLCVDESEGMVETVVEAAESPSAEHGEPMPPAE